MKLKFLMKKKTEFLLFLKRYWKASKSKSCVCSNNIKIDATVVCKESNKNLHFAWVKKLSRFFFQKTNFLHVRV